MSLPAIESKYVGGHVRRFIADAAKTCGESEQRVQELIADGQNVGFRPVRSVIEFLGADLSGLARDTALLPLSLSRQTEKLLSEVANITGLDETELAESIREGTKERGFRPVRSLIRVGGVPVEELQHLLRMSSSEISIDIDDIDRDIASKIGESACLRLRVVPIGYAETGECRLVRDDKSTSQAQRQAEQLVENTLNKHVEWSTATSLQVSGCLSALKPPPEPDPEDVAGNESASKSAQKWAELTESGTGRDGRRIDEHIKTLMARVLATEASDIHISTHVSREGEQESIEARLRIGGVLRLHKAYSLKDGKRVINRFCTAAGRTAADRKAQEGRFSITVPDAGRYDMRLYAPPDTAEGEKMLVMRVLAQNRGNLKKLDSLFPPQQSEHAAELKELLRKPRGMLIVAGATGSGKSTTLAAMLAEVCGVENKVITIEDPIEYSIYRADQRQVDEDHFTFSQALRGFLRADPNVLMVGELRDSDTAVTAVQAAETGHFVLSTVHSNDAASTPKRMIRLGGISSYDITDTLLGVFAQTLVRRLCPSCSSGTHNRKAEPRGCTSCGRSGWKGRVAVAEFMPVTPEIADAIEQHDAHPRAIRKIGGYHTFQDHARSLILGGVTTKNEIARHILDPPDVSHQPRKA